MAEDHLLAESISHIVKIEYTFFPLDLGVQCDVHQHIAKFFFEIFCVLPVDSFYSFICLFYQILPYRLMSLGLVPRTARYRISETLHQQRYIIQCILRFYPEF